MTALAPHVVGVDVGSSSARAVALDADGVVSADFIARYPMADASVRGRIDPAMWLSGLQAAVSGLGVGTPAALAIGGYGPCTVAANGQAALTFRYPVGDPSDPRDQHVAQTAELRQLFGPDVDPVLLWNWLIARLGGRSGIQSVWPGDEPLPEFGEPVSVGTAIGTTSGEFDLAAGIPLVPASNDGYLTAWAAGIDSPGLGFDPGGVTGGLGVAMVPSGGGEVAPYGIPSAAAGVQIVGGPVASHGAMLEWWAGLVGGEIGELLEAAASVAPGSDGVLVLPFLEGERAPRWNTELRAEIVGLHASHDAAVVTRAILESTAFGLAHIAREVAAQGAVLERLVCCGKPSRIPLWTSIKAAVLEVPVDVPQQREMAAYGAALAAGAALEWWPIPGAGQSGDWPTPEVTTVEAEPLTVYREQLEQFIALGDAAQARTTERHGVGRERV
ncbi:MAG: FGGY-family carbohydrate kinase [Acidimicrobiia bacterium]